MHLFRGTTSGTHPHKSRKRQNVKKNTILCCQHGTNCTRRKLWGEKVVKPGVIFACKEAPVAQKTKLPEQELHKRPFQSWREIEYAFCLLGITNLTGRLQSAYRVSNMKPIKRQLNNIAARRNSIVHEGDLVKHEREVISKRIQLHENTWRTHWISLTRWVFTWKRLLSAKGYWATRATH